MSKKTYTLITFSMILIMLIVNIILYSSLPDRVGLQISTSGELRNSIPKTVFVMMAPIVLLVLYGSSLVSQNKDEKRTLIIGGIFFILNFATIFLNM